MANDPVNSPPHYTAGAVEVIDYIEQVVADYPSAQGYAIGNVLKYISRAPHKGSRAQDLRKAQWYLNRAIAAEAARVDPDATQPSLVPLSEVLQRLEDVIQLAGSVAAFADWAGTSVLHVSEVRAEIAPPSERLLDHLGYRDAGRWYERKPVAG